MRGRMPPQLRPGSAYLSLTATIWCSIFSTEAGEQQLRLRMTKSGTQYAIGRDRKEFLPPRKGLQAWQLIANYSSPPRKRQRFFPKRIESFCLTLETG